MDFYVPVVCLVILDSFINKKMYSLSANNSMQLIGMAIL